MRQLTITEFKNHCEKTKYKFYNEIAPNIKFTELNTCLSPNRILFSNSSLVISYHGVKYVVMNSDGFRDSFDIICRDLESDCDKETVSFRVFGEKNGKK